MRRVFPLSGLLALALAACGDDAPLVHPAPVEAPSPFQYPVSLWDRGLQGETVILAHVTEDGSVDSARVSRSSGRAESEPGVRKNHVLTPADAEAFDSAAVQGAFRLRFVPAHRGGDRVAMWVKLPVRFSRDSAAADTAH